MNYLIGFILFYLSIITIFSFTEWFWEGENVVVGYSKYFFIPCLIGYILIILAN